MDKISSEASSPWLEVLGAVKERISEGKGEADRDITSRIANRTLCMNIDE